jgi:Na+/H+ antiporter NhaD/arsenite permease-like protein
MVKDIIQQMIKKHLGWLVVWGGVFGGLIGLIAAYSNL